MTATPARVRPAESVRIIDTAAARCQVSVVIPVDAPSTDVRALYEAFAAPLRSSGREFEFVVAASPNAVDDVRGLDELVRNGEPLRVVCAANSLNETALLRRGSQLARGDIIVALPPHLQVGPEALEPLLAAVEGGADVAVACRWPREGPVLNRVQSWALRRALGGLGGNRFHDLGCGVRAMRRQVFREVPLYGELSRFFPLLAHHAGFAVEEVKVAPHPNDRRLHLHSPGVYVRRLLDVLGLFFVLRFTDRPLRFFGLIGVLLGGVGSVIMMILLIDRANGVPVATRPLLLLGALFLALGLQSLAFGLVGEMIVHFNAGPGRFYRVKEIVERGRE